MTRGEIPTPALLLDLDRFERNIARMAAHVRAAGKALRPHAKTHRCPEIARRQVDAGALGVACAKLGEAEVMARAGIRGLLITTEVVAPAAVRRLMRLAAEAPDTMVVVDHPDNVDALARAAAEEGVTLGVLVDVDVGRRGGGGVRRGIAGQFGDGHRLFRSKIWAFGSGWLVPVEPWAARLPSPDRVVGQVCREVPSSA